MKKIAACVIQIILVILFLIPTAEASQIESNEPQTIVTLEVVDKSGKPVSNLNVLWGYEDLIQGKTKLDLLYLGMDFTDIDGVCFIPLIQKVDENGNRLKTQVMVQNRQDTANLIQIVYDLEMSKEKSVYTLVWEKETPKETSKKISPSLTLKFTSPDGKPMRNLYVQFTHPSEYQHIFGYSMDEDGMCIVPKYERGIFIIHAYSPSPRDPKTDGKFKMKSYYLDTDYDGSLTYNLIFD